MEEDALIGGGSRLNVLTGFLRRHFHRGRGGRAKLAISTSLFSRIIMTAVSFVVLPITVRYLGNEGYGLMTTITSVVGWLQFTNMGIGLGLQNALTEETAKGDTQGQRELISTAVVSLFGIGLILLVSGLIAFPHIPWQRVFPPITDRFAVEIPATVLVVFLGFVSTVVLGFVNPIYAARQELHIGAWQTMITGVLTLIGTVVAVRARWGLFGLTICTIGVTTVCQWSFAAWNLFFRGHSELRPRLGAFTRNAFRRIYKTGIYFFVLQICNIAFFQIDAFLIVRFLTIDQVTPYSVAQKVFVQLSAVFAVFTGSLWAAYGNAWAQADKTWIRKTHFKVLKLFAGCFAIVAVFMTLGGNACFRLWVGSRAAPSTLLIAGVIFYFAVREWNALHAMLLNGLNIIRPQVWCLVVTALMILSLDLLLVRRLGPVGLAVGGGLGSLLLGAWYLPYLVYKNIGIRAPVS